MYAKISEVENEILALQNAVWISIEISGVCT